MPAERLLKLLYRFAGGIRELSHQPLCPVLPQFYLQEIANVPSVCEEVSVRVEGVVVHVLRANRAVAGQDGGGGGTAL